MWTTGHSIGKLMDVPWVAGYDISCDGERASRKFVVFHQVLIALSFANRSFIS